MKIIVKSGRFPDVAQEFDSTEQIAYWLLGLRIAYRMHADSHALSIAEARGLK